MNRLEGRESSEEAAMGRLAGRVLLCCDEADNFGGGFLYKLGIR